MIEISKKIANLIISLRKRDELFQKSMRSIENHFYDISAMGFLFPIESKCLGEILGTFDDYFKHVHGLDCFANELYCQDVESITIDEEEFSLKNDDEVMKLLEKTLIMNRN